MMKSLGRHTVNSRNTQVILAILLVCLLGACSSFQDDSGGDDPIARVFDKYLYKKDIEDLVALGTTPEDSAKLVKRYLDTWVKQQLILNKAKLNLSDQQAFHNIEKQLDDYRISLIIYAYQRELIKQKLDTVVSEGEIQVYYNENVNNLVLKSDIVRVRYMKVPKGAPELSKAKKWCESKEEQDLAALEEYCHQYAKSFLLNDQEWIVLENLQLELGDNATIDVGSLKPDKLIELQDSLHVYLINVLALIKKEEPAPVEYESKRIREIVLNRRRSELIANMEAGAYQDGLSKNYFEVY